MSKLLRSDEEGAQGGGRILPLGRSQLHAHLPRLQVTGAPVTEQHVAGDVLASLLGTDVDAGAPDDRCHLELVVVLPGPRRYRHLVEGPEDGGWVGEVEDGLLVPNGTDRGPDSRER